MSDEISIVILAAGKGTRLKMDVPKPLAPIGDLTLVDFVIESAQDFGKLHLITGHQNDLVESHIKEKWPNLKSEYILQKEQLGTGHAVKTYFEGATHPERFKYTIVACADTPLLDKETFQKLIDEINDGFDAVCATFIEDNPTGYGRIIRADKGFSIVEEKDASDEQRKITEVNSGLYIFKTEYLKNHIFDLKSDNKAGEFYLTDTCKEGANVTPLVFEDKDIFLGVNNLLQLSIADRKLRNRNMKSLLLDKGVRLIDMSHSYVYSNDIGEGTTIYPNVQIDSKTKIGKNAVIEAGCIINNSVIEDGVHLKAYTYLTDAIVRKDAKVGPMAQLRPGSDIGEGSKLGNFVEVKKSKLDKKVSVSHLSYVGDAEIGQNVNIGCGFITCNYDGANKHKTIIKEGSFIGSDCQMVAPVTIGKEAYVGSGSTINKDVPDGAFAIARERQVTKEGMAKKFIKKKNK
jgi:bifunctional UDP-N-acetylglucosamine pyrophosphorylase/glucosamine-1-phosphate N-acetyltransferase